MNLIQAKQAAYGAAHRAARLTEDLMKLPDAALTLGDAENLLRDATALQAAALEVELRIKGVPEAKLG